MCFMLCVRSWSFHLACLGHEAGLAWKMSNYHLQQEVLRGYSVQRYSLDCEYTKTDNVIYCNRKQAGENLHVWPILDLHMPVCSIETCITLWEFKIASWWAKWRTVTIRWFTYLFTHLLDLEGFHLPGMSACTGLSGRTATNLHWMLKSKQRSDVTAPLYS